MDQAPIMDELGGQPSPAGGAPAPGMGLPIPQGAGQPQAAPQPMPLPAPPPQQCTIDDVVDLFRSTALRRFRIDIETDSTVTGDESQERQDRQGLIENLTKMVEAWGPIVQQQPVMANLAGELMMFGVRAFRVGRTLEETIQETVDKLQAELGQPKPPPQPSPDEMVKLQGIKEKTAAEIQKAQIGVQQTQADAQAKLTQAQMESQSEERKHQLEMIRMMTQLKHDRERHQMEMLRADQTHSMTLQAKQQDAESKKELASTKADAPKKAKAKSEAQDKLLQELHAHLTAKRSIARDEAGGVIGVEVNGKVIPAKRDANGRIIGLEG